MTVDIGLGRIASTFFRRHITLELRRLTHRERVPIGSNTLIVIAPRGEE
jgi:hypothetical protein